MSDGGNTLKIFKIKQFFRNAKYRVSLIFSFPHFWICILIILLAIVSLWISHALYRSHQDFLFSIFANIFAGLVTGLIICLLSGVKQFYIAKLKNKKNWLEHIRTMVSDYIDLYHKLAEKQFTTFDGTEELFNFIYDVGSHANWINDDILQSTFDKSLSFNPREYCKKYLNYDAYALVDEFSKLHDYLYEVDINFPSKKDILCYFEKVHKNLMRLHSNAYRQLRDIEIRLQEAEKSII